MNTEKPDAQAGFTAGYHFLRHVDDDLGRALEKQTVTLEEGRR